MFALHAPDGFLEPPVALATALISLAVVAVVVRRSEQVLTDRLLPLAGVTAAFVFAAQLINVPVAAGTTGHLLGATLAAVLLGPSTGALVMTIVVVVQALIFADGGLSALGYNVLDMAIVPAIGGYALFVLLRRMMPHTAGGVIGAAGLAAAASVVLSAATFSVLWLFGASAPVPFDDVFTAMVGVHLLIGIGEGVITAIALRTVIAARPDLVSGLPDAATAGPVRVTSRTFVIGALLTAIVLATVVSQFASDGPDGLERVAEDRGFAGSADTHALASGWFADYATSGVDDPSLSLAIAGFVGVFVSGLLAVGFVLVARDRPRSTRRTPASATEQVSAR